MIVQNACVLKIDYLILCVIWHKDRMWLFYSYYVLDGDRYRTAAAQINIGPFGIGTNMISGDAGPYRNNRGGFMIDENGNKIYLPNNGYNPDKYRMGTFYFKLGPVRVGRNSEQIRHVFQNRFAHDFMTGGKTYWFNVLDLKPRWYWGVGSGGGTLW